MLGVTAQQYVMGERETGISLLIQEQMEKTGRHVGNVRGGLTHTEQRNHTPHSSAYRAILTASCLSCFCAKNVGFLRGLWAWSQAISSFLTLLLRTEALDL